MKKIPNFFTIDVEGWSDRLVYKKREVAISEAYQDEIRRSCLALLNLLEMNNSSATFFFLGKAILGNEELLQRIVDSGSEIGIHGFNHVELFDLTPQEFDTQLNKTNQLIFNAIGKYAVGYRAPKFSLNQTTSWAIDVLKNNGFLYDASIYPATSRHYLSVLSPSAPYKICSSNVHEKSSNSEFLEFPITLTSTLLGKLPTKIRYFPLSMIDKTIERHNEAGIPATIFIHPWEVIKPKGKRLLSPKAIMRDYNIPCLHSVAELLSSRKFSSIENKLEQFL